MVPTTVSCWRQLKPITGANDIVSLPETSFPFLTTPVHRQQFWRKKNWRICITKLLCTLYIFQIWHLVIIFRFLPWKMHLKVYYDSTKLNLLKTSSSIDDDLTSKFLRAMNPQSPKPLWKKCRVWTGLCRKTIKSIFLLFYK